MDRALNRISVIIPVYNHAAYLPEALESVFRQTYPASEIIVVDDGSEDGSAEAAERFSGVRVFRQPHSGIAVARNAGVRHTQGDLISFLDADDRWTSYKLRAQIEAFDREPGLDMVFGLVRQFLSPDLSEVERGRRKIEQEIMPGRIPGTLLIRRASLDRVGTFNEGLRSAEFLDWYGRAQVLGLQEKMLEDVFCERRIHAANHGVRARETRLDYFKALKASVDRRKNMEGPES